MLCGCCADVVWMLCGCVELCPMSNTTRDGAMKGTMPLPRLTAERLTNLGSISANAEKTRKSKVAAVGTYANYIFEGVPIQGQRLYKIL